MSRTSRPGEPERAKSHMWTKQEFGLIVDLWDRTTLEELASKLGVSKLQLQAIVWKLRRSGVDLPRKTQKGVLDGLIREFLEERGMQAGISAASPRVRRG